MYTVKDLYEAVKKQIEMGNGDKIIVVADDEEGNGYHYLPYLLTTKKEEIRCSLEVGNFCFTEKSLEKIVILG